MPGFARSHRFDRFRARIRHEENRTPLITERLAQHVAQVFHVLGGEQFILIDEQQKYHSKYKFACCDLLSKCIFDLLTNNMENVASKTLRVVICFQNVSLTY